MGLSGGLADNGGGATGASGSASGDLSGTYPAPTVAKVKGKAVDTPTTKGDLFAYDGTAVKRVAAGSDGQVLTANAAAAAGVDWEAAAGGLPAYSVWMPPIDQRTVSGAGVPASNNIYYVVEVWVPTGTVLTGIQFFVTTQSGNVLVGLCDSTGARVASSASTAVGASSSLQRVPFTATYTPTPGRFLIETVWSSNAGTIDGGRAMTPTANSVQGSFALPASPVSVPGAPTGQSVPVVSTY